MRNLAVLLNGCACTKEQIYVGNVVKLLEFESRRLNSVAEVQAYPTWSWLARFG